MPVYNVTDEPVITASGTTPSLAQVKSAIITACRDKGWIVDPGAEGHIVATVQVRQHTAAIDIHYSPEHYTITYKDSRSEEHTSELQSLMRISYAVFCLKKKHTPHTKPSRIQQTAL